MHGLADQIAEAADFIRGHWGTTPRAGIILGSGLGNFSEHMQIESTLPYGDIPHFPHAAESSVIGHKGSLLLGTANGVPVVTMAGRFHFYEGYGIQDITLPVRVMKALGIELLIVSNASGGLNPQYKSGDIMVLDDHINLMFENPLMGVNDDDLGPRFPDMSAPYDKELIEQAIAIGHENGFTAHRGVYIGMSGPTYETRAEYRMQRTLGADVAGMSTVPEVIVAVHAGMRSIGFSVVTDMCFPDSLQAADAHEIVKIAQGTEPQLRALVAGVLAEMP